MELYRWVDGEDGYEIYEVYEDREDTFITTSTLIPEDVGEWFRFPEYDLGVLANMERLV